MPINPFDEQDKFTCPRCGSHNFGPSGFPHEVACNGYVEGGKRLCDYRFVREPAAPPKESPTIRVGRWWRHRNSTTLVRVYRVEAWPSCLTGEPDRQEVWFETSDGTKRQDRLLDTLFLEYYRPHSQPGNEHESDALPDPPSLKCEGTSDCKQPVTHAEHYNGRIRGWCENHTPWSGHGERCGDQCRKWGGTGVMVKTDSRDAATIAFDEIVKICDVPTWDYPGQVIRDVRMLRDQRDKAMRTLARLVKACGADRPDPVCEGCGRRKATSIGFVHNAVMLLCSELCEGMYPDAPQIRLDEVLK